MATPFAGVLGSVTQTAPVAALPARCAGALGSVTQTSPVLSSPGAAVASTFYILAETGDVINAENSDRMRTE